MRARRRGAAGALVIASALVLTACGGGGDSGSKKSDDSTKTSAGSSAASDSTSPATKPGKIATSELFDINLTPRDQVKDGGTITLAIDQFSTQWNYNQTNGPEAATSSVITTMLPSPFLTKADGSFAPDPNYVSSFKLTSAPKQVVTLELNPKAVWSDGTKVTAADYVAEWSALNGKNTAYQIASSTGYDQIGSVKQGKAPTEVVISFDKPFGDWKTLFSPLYPAAVNKSPKTFNTGLVGKLPLSAGPFIEQKLDKAAQTVTVKRNARWWGPAPKLDTIVFRSMDREAEAGAFVNGETDALGIGSNASNYKQAKDVKDVAFHKSLGTAYSHFILNGEAADLKDVRVRQAIVMGLDRKVIAESSLKGLPVDPLLLVNHFYLPGQAAYQDNAGEFGKFDPDRAGSLLDAAGWKKDGDYRKKDGKTLDISFTIPSGNPVADNFVTLATVMLKNIGIKVTTASVATSKFFDDYVLPGKYEMSGFQWEVSSSPASSAKSIFQMPTKPAKGPEQVYQNFARVGTKQIDGLFDQAIQQLDPVKAAASLNQADKLIFAEAIIDPLYLTPNIIATKKNLCNYGAATFATTTWQDVGFHK